MTYKRYDKIWFNDTLSKLKYPGLYIEQDSNHIHKILIYFEGFWIDKDVSLDQIEKREITISLEIYKFRKETLDYGRIE